MAAIAWAIHDLLVRKLTQSSDILPMLLVVLATGSVALLGPALLMGGWDQMTWTAAGWAIASGLTYVGGAFGLYKALSLAPVRVVAPILGAYPIVTLGLTSAQGTPVTPAEWLAVLFIVAGIAWVASTNRHGEAQVSGYPVVSIPWAILGAVGFAVTFALGQEATRQGAEGPAILLIRLAAAAGAAVLVVLARSRRPAAGAVKVLTGMGILDALALALVTAAANLPDPEYAAVASALFGVLTILLASRFLGEKVAGVQWLGIVAVFSGIAVLSMQG